MPTLKRRRHTKGWVWRRLREGWAGRPCLTPFWPFGRCLPAAFSFLPGFWGGRFSGPPGVAVRFGGFLPALGVAVSRPPVVSTRFGLWGFAFWGFLSLRGAPQSCVTTDVAPALAEQSAVCLDRPPMTGELWAGVGWTIAAPAHLGFHSNRMKNWRAHLQFSVWGLGVPPGFAHDAPLAVK